MQINTEQTALQYVLERQPQRSLLVRIGNGA
jgi:hypothetical protein